MADAVPPQARGGVETMAVVRHIRWEKHWPLPMEKNEFVPADWYYSIREHEFERLERKKQRFTEEFIELYRRALYSQHVRPGWPYGA